MRALPLLLVSVVATCARDQPTAIPGAPPRLVFTAEPHDVVVGDAMSPVEVTAVDPVSGNKTDFRATITIALGQHRDSAKLVGITSVTAASGVATFSNVNIDQPGTSYTLIASSEEADSRVESVPFSVRHAPGQVQFGFHTLNGMRARTVITPPIEVRAYDRSGVLLTTDSIVVTVALGANPGAADLQGTRTVTTVNGKAVFTDLSVSKPGSGYTLTASAPGFAGDFIGVFNVAPFPARLIFFDQPSETPAGSHILSGVTIPYSAGDLQPIWVRVYAVDSAGYNSLLNDSVTIALGTNPSGATLSGTRTLYDVSDYAELRDLRINKAGRGYTLTATAHGLASATSAPFDILPPANTAAVRLAFATVPFPDWGSPPPQAGTILPPVKVVVMGDSWPGRGGYDNIVTAYAGAVTLSLDSNAAGGTLSGTRTVNAINGWATFSDLVIDKGGTFSFTATAAGLASGKTPSFAIAPIPTRLAFFHEPPTSYAGLSAIPTDVLAYDSLGNVAEAFSSPVTLSLGANPGGGTLTGSLIALPTRGYSQFYSVAIDKPGSGYTLVASAPGVSSATSAPFDVYGLAFIEQPTNASAGRELPPFQVAVVDGSGNVIIDYRGTVRVKIGNDASHQNAVLAGGSAVNGDCCWVTPFNGVGELRGLSINQPGDGYTLTAAIGWGHPVATSAPFNIIP